MMRIRYVSALCIAAASVVGCGQKEQRAARPPAASAPATPASDGDTPSSRSSARVEYYPSAGLGALATKLGGGAPTAKSFSKHSGFIAIQIRRTATGEPEVHDAWTDVTIVQSGRASLLTGGTVQGGRIEAPGEHRGGTISGGKPYPLAAGDVIIVPAGVAHQFEIARGDSLRYLTIKVTPDRPATRR